MTKYLLAAAAVAAIALSSSAAFAEDAKATAPKAMSDSEMNRVTAAGGPPPTNVRGQGLGTAINVDANLGQTPLKVPEHKALGTDTAPGPAVDRPPPH
jgi:hypothetical protein